MFPYVLFIMGSWFGLVVMSLMRIAADRKECEGCAAIALTNRRGERVVFGADGSRRIA